jgi:cystathionine beta-lyase
MIHNFDEVLDRRPTDSVKWNYYGDALPLWVADMDFRAPEPVIRALHQRVEHGIFGYGTEPPELRSLLVERLHRLYGWEVAPEALFFVPGVVSGFNLATRAVTRPGDGLLVQTPVYFPILRVPRNVNLVMNEMQLTWQPDGQYEIDLACLRPPSLVGPVYSSCAIPTTRSGVSFAATNWSTWPRSACATTS